MPESPTPPVEVERFDRAQSLIQSIEFHTRVANAIGNIPTDDGIVETAEKFAKFIRN